MSGSAVDASKPAKSTPPPAAPAPAPTCSVFLGGSCNPTTWRETIAIPSLEKNKITYYNPQVKDWHEGLIRIEAENKEGAACLLFVLDNETRAIASIGEACFYMGDGRKVVLAIQYFDTKELGSKPLDEIKDLNRGRTYVADMAKMKNIPVFDDVKKAVDHIVTHRGDFGF